MKLGNDPSHRLVLTPLETAVLEVCGSRLGAAASAWRRQCSGLHVTGRSFSGVGFVTRLETAEDAPPLDEAAARHLRPAYAAHPLLEEPAQFVVQLRHGRLIALEGFCFDGMWPDNETAFGLPVLR